MNHQFEMEYGSRQLTRFADKLKDLGHRLNDVHINPLTQGEIVDTQRMLYETIAEMRLVAQDLTEWQSEKPKKKFWQFWK